MSSGNDLEGIEVANQKCGARELGMPYAPPQHSLDNGGTEMLVITTTNWVSLCCPCFAMLDSLRRGLDLSSVFVF
jgi:hypothetical protein